MIIMKFGGASTSNADGVRGVSKIVESYRDRHPVIVVSAMGKTTRALDRAARLAVAGHGAEAAAECAALIDRHVQLAREALGAQHSGCAETRIEAIRGRLVTLIDGLSIVRELSARSLDACLSLGEQLASSILAEAIDDVSYVPASNIFVTDDAFTRAAPRLELLHANVTQKIAPLVAQGRVVLTEGYVGATIDGTPTTMGMESSDYSATLLGAALQAEEVQIWTNVDGIMTVDPRVSASARTIAAMTYDEAEELAMLGAKILHPRTIGPARESGVPITVRNSSNPGGTHTRIHDDRISASGVKAIAVADHLHRKNMSAGVAPMSSADFVFSVQAGEKMSVWYGSGDPTATGDACAAISLVGKGVAADLAVTRNLLECADGIAVEALIVGASILSVSIIVPSHGMQAIVERLHRRLFA